MGGVICRWCCAIMRWRRISVSSSTTESRSGPSAASAAASMAAARSVEEPGRAILEPRIALPVCGEISRFSDMQ